MGRKARGSALIRNNPRYNFIPRALFRRRVFEMDALHRSGIVYTTMAYDDFEGEGKLPDP